MNLSGDEIKQLVNAIISAYPTKDDLDMMKIEKPPHKKRDNIWMTGVNGSRRVISGSLVTHSLLASP